MAPQAAPTRTMAVPLAFWDMYDLMDVDDELRRIECPDMIAMHSCHSHCPVIPTAALDLVPWANFQPLCHRASH